MPPTKRKPRASTTRPSRPASNRPASSSPDSALDVALCAWFRANARDLAWRHIDPKTGRRNPYFSLVSELMLQQTQVSRVIDKFRTFTTRFPTVQTLAAAPLDDVLAEWSGLGYYRRARHLHAAAQAIVRDFQGEVPSDVNDLLKLPGIGRYTAGALASLVYHQPAPIVDGNVARVLLRVKGVALDQQQGMTWAWKQTETLAVRSSDVAAFNEGLMELGAVVCTPANPRCQACPLTALCVARQQGLQDSIPQPKQRAVRSQVTFSTILVRDAQGRVLLEKRPVTGLWADMWQPPTLESTGPRPTPAKLAKWLGVPSLRRVSTFLHHTSHRAVEFVVYEARPKSMPAALTSGRSWFTSTQLESLALGNAQREILRLKT